MLLFGLSLGLLLAGTLLPLLPPRSSPWGARLGVAAAVAAAACGLAGALRILVQPAAAARIDLPWSLPYGSFALAADPLAAFFLMPIFLLTGLAAVYGRAYLREHEGGRPSAGAWSSYNALTAAMVLVVLAHNAILFLMAWELMAVTSFLLVTRDSERGSVRRAGWVYLVAGHLGTTALFMLFVLLGRTAGSFDFEHLAAAAASEPGRATLFFALALVGFGTKAGLVPLHVWLPEAHPAAPSHVSAVMSGAMIKTGVYGILRLLSWLGPPVPAWAWLLIGGGLLSGALGVLLALTQRDLKRELAYSSIEHSGIILVGFGLGVLGQAQGDLALVVLGYGGALLHVLSHAAGKGLLFLSVGSVQCAAHGLDFDRLGGLQRRMPWTSTAFLFGAVAICGLPPLGGFASEFMLLLGGFHGARLPAPGAAAPAFLLLIGLAMLGGLATAAFTRAFGIAFLGHPRTAAAAQAREMGPGMLGPLGVLAALSLLVGLGAPWLLALVAPVMAVTTGLPAAAIAEACAPIAATLKIAVLAGALLAGLVLGLAVWRRALLARRAPRTGLTWDCGFAQPTARMQYTASSFTQPLIQFFTVLRQRRQFERPQGLFPAAASLATETADTISTQGWRPAFYSIGWLLMKLHRMQTGSIHLYILYIALTLIVLLIWRLR